MLGNMNWHEPQRIVVYSFLGKSQTMCYSIINSILGSAERLPDLTMKLARLQGLGKQDQQMMSYGAHCCLRGKGIMRCLEAVGQGVRIRQKGRSCLGERRGVGSGGNFQRFGLFVDASDNQLCKIYLKHTEGPVVLRFTHHYFQLHFCRFFLTPL